MRARYVAGAATAQWVTRGLVHRGPAEQTPVPGALMPSRADSPARALYHLVPDDRFWASGRGCRIVSHTVQEDTSSVKI